MSFSTLCSLLYLLVTMSPAARRGRNTTGTTAPSPSKAQRTLYLNNQKRPRAEERSQGRELRGGTPTPTTPHLPSLSSSTPPLPPGTDSMPALKSMLAGMIQSDQTYMVPGHTIFNNLGLLFQVCNCSHPGHRPPSQAPAEKTYSRW